MWLDPQFSADFVTFTEEILEGKFCVSVSNNKDALIAVLLYMECFASIGLN